MWSLLIWKNARRMITIIQHQNQHSANIRLSKKWYVEHLSLADSFCALICIRSLIKDNKGYKQIIRRKMFLIGQKSCVLLLVHVLFRPTVNTFFFFFLERVVIQRTKYEIPVMLWCIRPARHIYESWGSEIQVYSWLQSTLWGLMMERMFAG